MTGFIEDEYEEDTQRGRFLTFTLGENIYGIPILFVKEIVGIQTATKVPGTPDYVKGIISLRGRIIPLIDVRLKFGRAQIPYTERTCVIVIDAGPVTVGLIVDKVDAVLKLDDHQIAPPSGDAAFGFENRYIGGIGKSDNAVLLLLDVDKILKADESEMIDHIAAGNV